MTTQESKRASERGTSDHGHPWRWFLALLVCSAVSGLVGFGVGYGGHLGEVRALSAEVEAARSQGLAQRHAVEVELAELQKHHAEEELRSLGHIQRLEARRQLNLALDAMDARNFGIAQGNLQAASRMLAAAGDAAVVRELAAEIGEVNLVAVADFEEQRRIVREFATRLDELLAKERELDTPKESGPASPERTPAEKTPAEKTSAEAAPVEVAPAEAAQPHDG